MGGTDAGWYGEPGNPGLERYWDGTQWTPQTRPAPMAEAATSGLAAASCAIPSCISQRAAGSEFCPKHNPQSGPVADATTRPTPAPGERGNAALVCPHCQTRGAVSTREVEVKRGISGGKATAAVTTLGFSMLATGLSRKEKHTQMTCGNCRTTWLV